VETEDKAREKRVRRLAQRRGLVLKKSRRAAGTWDFGRYWLLDGDRDTLVFPDEHGASLDDVESYLASNG
jgi:hypothetical protein